MTRAIALLLTVLTGFSGLVYEVAWQRYLATMLGSQSEATAAILGLFLGGLSAGYAIFGALTRRVVSRAERAGRPPRLLTLYGAVESGIGLYALLFPTLFGFVQRISIAIPHEAAGIGFAYDVALTACLILPPTILMGGTIPILTQALARDLSDATRFHAFVYAFNTAGAFAGALAAGFVLVPWLGLARVVVAMGCVNLLAGGLFLLLGARRRAVAGALSPSTPALSGAALVPEGFLAYAVVALLSGFAMMAIQTVLNRVGALAFGASQFTFSMVVAVFVLCIALGSFVVSALPRIRPVHLVVSQWVLVVLLLLLYRELPNATYWAHALRSLFRDDDAAFYPYYIAAFLCALAVLAVPIGISGATLPLLFHHLRGQVEDLGSVAGRLYSWNTVGSLFGALVGGYVLLFFVDLHAVYRIALGALAVGAAILSVRLLGASPVMVGFLVLLPALAGIALQPKWDPVRLSAGLFRVRQPIPQTSLGPDAVYAVMSQGLTIPFYHDDPVTSVAMKEHIDRSHGLRRSIINNGKSDGEIPGDYPTMVLAATIPALLADRAEHGLLIGFGTGVTAGELGALPDMREVVVSEISSGVVQAAPYFDYGNQEASKNPKVKIVRGDAYRMLLRSQGSFDVIASEPSNPWVTGVEMLYSQEFLTAARDRLNPGGVYAQWFHIYETDGESLALVLRTYASVFDEVAVWYAAGTDLLLLGFQGTGHALDVERLEARAAAPAMRASLDRAGIQSFPGLLAHELLPLGVLRAAELHGDVHTLLHPVLSYRAARAFFRGQVAEMPPTYGPAASRVGAENSLLRRYAARSGGLSEQARREVVNQLCRHRPFECATFLAQWQHDVPGSSTLAHALEDARSRDDFRPEVGPQHLEALTALFGSGLGGGSGAVPLAQATEDTNLFVRNYYHAAPFPRPVLEGLWRRCESVGDADGGRRCANAWAKASSFVGGLGGPAITAENAPDR